MQGKASANFCKTAPHPPHPPPPPTQNTWRSPMRTSADNQLFLRRLEAATTGFAAPAANAGMPRTSNLDSIAAQVLVAQQQQRQQQQQQQGSFTQLALPVLAEAREGGAPPAPGMPPCTPLAPSGAADVPGRGQAAPVPVLQAVLPAYAALMSPGACWLGCQAPALGCAALLADQIQSMILQGSSCLSQLI